MKVLSLFDGISCGMLALLKCGFDIEEYVAYEIDEYAIKVSQTHFSNIKQCGTVVGADFTQYEGYDLLLAGFPCQDLSIATTNRKGLDGERSGLFWELVRALEEVKPKYFLVENNHNMPKKDMEVITEILGVEPIMIDSALVSAQKRKRLYWTNIPNVTQPKNQYVYVRDILEGSTDEINYFEKTKLKDDAFFVLDTDKPKRVGVIGKGGQGERVYSINGKCTTIKANGGGMGGKTGLYLIDETVRKLTPLETERAQRLPDNYTLVDGLKNVHRYRCVGNGWTIDVIAHILNFIKE